MVQHGRENHLRQMIHKGTVTNVTTKHKNFNFYKTKMNQKDRKTPASNITDKRVIPKHYTKRLRKRASLLK